jgi:ABC-type sugar transport system ATPase subunit
VRSPDSGEIHVHGKKVDNWSVAAARRAGIENLYQDRALAEQQAIARNFVMGHTMTRFLGFLWSTQSYEEDSIHRLADAGREFGGI